VEEEHTLLVLGGVFKVSRSGNRWKGKAVYEFTGSDGGVPWAGLTFDSAGSLSGTTLSALPDYGVVFKLSQSRSGWTKTVLHSFNGFNGMWPYGGVVLDQDGVVYGTTATGGNGF
jgi:hypothetical protein